MAVVSQIEPEAKFALPFLLLAIPFAYAHVEARWRSRFLQLDTNEGEFAAHVPLDFRSQKARVRYSSFRLVLPRNTLQSYLRYRSKFPR